jgi:hypothetical protein
MRIISLAAVGSHTILGGTSRTLIESGSARQGLPA